MEAFSGPFICSCFCSGTGACGLASGGAHESSPQPFHSAPPHLPRRHACCRLGSPSAPFTQSAAAKSATMSSTKPGHAPACTAAHAPQSFTRFATGLIAAKPGKPCDGAVFGAFYLLLFLQWNRGLRPGFRRGTRKRPATIRCGRLRWPPHQSGKAAARRSAAESGARPAPRGAA